MQARPPLSGWLLKRKSEQAKSRLFKGTNRRHFTLDFQTQIFYYAHNEGKKTVSMPTHFRAITSVEPFADTFREPGEDEDGMEEEAATPMQRSASKGSLASSLRMPRIPSLSSRSKKPIERHGFIVRTQGKSLELICESKEEAEKWIGAIREAMEMAQRNPDLGKDACCEEVLAKAELSTEPGSSSSRGTSPRSSSHGSLSASRQATPPQRLAAMGGQDEASAIDSVPLDARRPNETPSRLLPKPATSSSDAGAPPPATETTAWMEKPHSTASSPLASSSRAASMPAQVASLVPPRSARSTSSGEKRSPRHGYVTSVISETADGAAFKCWHDVREGEDHDADMAARYADKGQGLSVAQRLSQLEFSDDEDEDDPDGYRSTSAQVANEQTKASEIAKEHAQPSDSVVVEACETFIAPDSDTE